MENSRKIYIFEMLKYSIREYVTFIVCLIISFCVVFIYYYKNESNIIKKQGNKEEQELTSVESQAVDHVVNLRKRFAGVKYYYYNGVTMNIDATCTPQMTLEYSLKGGCKEVLEIIAQTVNNESVSNVVLNKYKGVVNDAEIKTLITSEIREHSLVISIVGNSKSMCEEISEIVINAINNKIEEIKPIYSDADVYKTDQSFGYVLNEHIYEAQKLTKEIYDTTYSKYQRALKDLTELQLKEYKIKIGDEVDNKENIVTEANSKRQIIMNFISFKWFLIIILVGFGAGLVINCFIYCFRKTIRNIYEIEDLNAFSFVYGLSHRNEREKRYTINLIQKKVSDSENSKVYFDCDCELTVTEKEYIDLLIAKLKENGCNVEEIDSLIDEKGDINVDTGNIILIRKSMVSRYDWLCKEVKMYDDIDISKIGVVVF